MFSVTEENGFKSLKYHGNSVFPGEVLYYLKGPVESEPTRTSIQIGPNKHIEDIWGQYINHNCDPNIKIIDNNLVTLKEINDGDDITFDYNVSEENMASPFVCNCCGKLINGYSNK
jgi:SET domain-containing protein